MTPSSSDPEKFIRAMLGSISEERILLDENSCKFFSGDFSEEILHTTIAVVRPNTADEVSAIMKTAADCGVSVTARGGGMSYTKSHLPPNPNTVVLDTSGMNSILTIDKENRFVVVEPGVTWKQLRDALKPTGYRVPYLGTLSGMIATVGGGASQNATGMGRMTLAEHILGLEVVLGNGDIVTTGSAITKNTLPFYRYNGPDLTGLFLCDSGAFGFKTKIVLQLEPVPCASFGCVAFSNRMDLVQAQAELAQLGLHTEAFAFDEYFVEEYAKMPSPAKPEIQAMLQNYWSSPGNSGWRGLLKLLRAWHPRGLKFLAGRGTVMYYTCEGADQRAADSARRKVDALMKRHKGKLIPTSIPFALRHGPFLNIGDMMTNAQGEVNYPINGKFAASQATAAMTAYHDFLRENHDDLEKFGIRMACNTLLHGHFFGIEPVVFWKKPLSHYRNTFASDKVRQASAAVQDDAERTAYAISLRYKMAAKFRELGVLHVQWGRVYGYADAIGRPETLDFIKRLKQATDPHHVVNPGSLGL